MMDTIDLDHWTDRAGTDAADRLQCEGTIFRRLAGLDPESPFGSIEQQRSLSDMTSRAHADPQEVLPLGFKREDIVETGNGMDLRAGYA